MLCRDMSASGGHPSCVISKNVRSMRLQIIFVSEGRINILQRQIMPRDVAQFPAQNIVRRPHSNYKSLIHSGF